MTSKAQNVEKTRSSVLSELVDKLFAWRHLRAVRAMHKACLLDDAPNGDDSSADPEKHTALDEARKDCKLVEEVGYAGRGGWDDILAKAFYQVEFLNQMTYPKFRVKATTAEVKDKFGDLRMSFDVCAWPSKTKMLLALTCKRVSEFLARRVDYHYARVEDFPPSVEVKIEEMPKSKWLRKKRSADTCSNVDAIERDGKYYIASYYTDYGDTHMEPTKHKILAKIRDFTSRYANPLVWRTEPTRKQRIAMQWLQSRVDAIVAEAERSTETACEECGQTIGSEWSPRCTTTGWVSHLCIACAVKSGKTYTKNGEVWSGNKLITTKEEAEAKRKEVDARYEAKMEEIKKQDDELEAQIAAEIEKEAKASCQREALSNEDQK